MVIFHSRLFVLPEGARHFSTWDPCYHASWGFPTEGTSSRELCSSPEPVCHLGVAGRSRAGKWCETSRHSDVSGLEHLNHSPIWFKFLVGGCPKLLGPPGIHWIHVLFSMKPTSSGGVPAWQLGKASHPGPWSVEETHFVDKARLIISPHHIQCIRTHILYILYIYIYINTYMYIYIYTHIYRNKYVYVNI